MISNEALYELLRDYKEVHLVTINGVTLKKIKYKEVYLKQNDNKGVYVQLQDSDNKFFRISQDTVKRAREWKNHNLIELTV